MRPSSVKATTEGVKREPSAVDDDFRFFAFVNGDDTVGRAQIDSNNSTHVRLSFSVQAAKFRVKQRTENGQMALFETLLHRTSTSQGANVTPRNAFARLITSRSQIRISIFRSTQNADETADFEES